MLQDRKEEARIQLWRDHNDLKDTRPLIWMLDLENGWNELLPMEFTCQCEGKMAQEWEMWLHKELIYAEKIKCDKPIEAKFYRFRIRHTTPCGALRKRLSVTSRAAKPLLGKARLPMT